MPLHSGCWAMKRKKETVWFCHLIWSHSHITKRKNINLKSSSKYYWDFLCFRLGSRSTWHQWRLHSMSLPEERSSSHSYDALDSLHCMVLFLSIKFLMVPLNFPFQRTRREYWTILFNLPIRTFFLLLSWQPFSITFFLKHPNCTKDSMPPSMECDVIWFNILDMIGWQSFV